MAKLLHVKKRGCQVEIQSILRQSQANALKIHLYVALPKGDRQRILVDSLNQLGVDALTPLRCTRSVALPADGALRRLSKTVVESCKQCGRNQLMSIERPSTIQELPASGSDVTTLRLFAHPYQQAEAFGGIQLSNVSSVECLIGPEGGLTDEEVAYLRRSSWRQVALGNQILRVETAAMATAAFLSLQRSWLASRES